MDIFEWDEIYSQYLAEKRKRNHGLENDINVCIMITYECADGFRTFPIVDVCNSPLPHCIEGTCLSSFPEHRTGTTGMLGVDYGTSYRTFNIYKIINAEVITNY